MHISQLFGTPWHFNVKLPGHHESDAQLTKMQDVHAIATVNSDTITTITATEVLR